jgi:uncharacterized protein YbjT (DUF2867 family)
MRNRKSKSRVFGMSSHRKVLVTGATGYVGGRLVESLLNNGIAVRVFIRDKGKIKDQPWAKQVEVAVGNANDFESLRDALTGIHTAFYLLHSLNMGKKFDEIEQQMAANFARAAKEADVKQIVYLGGIANDKKASQHLASRAQVGTELAATGVPTMELRAGIIIGAGSASFEMVRHLTHRLPIMTTPKWISNLTHPIGIRDVLWYLVNAAQLERPVSAVFDIGGPDVMKYSEMMQIFAKVSGLRKRIIVKIPVLTPRLASLWIGLVTPLPSALARPLVHSLISEVVADPEKSIDAVIPKPPQGLMGVEQAMELALARVNENKVKTRWSDATLPAHPWQKAQSDPSWAGEVTYKDSRSARTDASLASAWETIEEIGGDTGWYGADFLWFLRGLLDRLIGGVGLRRGRRDPKHLRLGDSLDFWRVESLEREDHLRLYAEMILPGKAWLEFRVRRIPEGNQIEITQEAIFLPRGLGGTFYWYLVKPFHAFVFPTMLRNIVRSAKRKDYFEAKA